jgi:hypothetical protein
MELQVIGIDFGKAVFPLVALNQRGEIVVRKKLSRKQLLHFTANLRVDLIGMEACGGAHFLGRALREQGHEVRLMPANDHIDAEVIAEVVTRPRMRFVPIKTDDQLDMQSLHRVRERWGDASHGHRQPDSCVAARTWHHSAKRPTTRGCRLAGHSRRRHGEAVNCIARIAGAVEAGT